MRNLQVVVFTCLTLCCHAQNNYSDSLKKLLAANPQPIEKFDLQNKLLEYSYISGGSNPDSSYCFNMLGIAQELDDDSLLAVAYNQVGNNFFRNNGDLSHALEYFFKGIPYAESVQDKRRLSSLYLDIAAIYHRLKNRPEEINYIRKAFDWLPDKSAPLYSFMLAQGQYHLCNYFLSQSHADSALFYAQALGVTNLHLKSPLFEAASQGMMGEAYDKKGDTALAAIHITRANALNNSIQYIWGRIEGKRAYINYLIRHNKFAEVKSEALQMIALGSHKKLYEIKRMAAGFLTSSYESSKQPDSAYYYSRLESALKDSVLDQENLNKIQALEFDERIRVLEEEDRIADAAERRRLNIQYVLITLGIVVFILLFFLLTNSIIITEKTISFLGVLGLLIVFEFINLLIHPFLEKITHHTPVLMLLALVVIASMLIPLHHRLEKWINEKMTEKNKKIRLAAAKKTIEQLEGSKG